MTDIHKGGRPKIIRPANFYQHLLDEYETHTTGDMAKMYNVSKATISRWLKIARTGGAAHGETEQ